MCYLPDDPGDDDGETGCGALVFVTVVIAVIIYALWATQ